MLYRFWLKHNYKLWWGIVASVLVGYPMAVMHLNPHPSEENTERVSGHVLRAHRDQPHISLQLTDGRIENFDFPDDLLNLLTPKGLLATGVTDAELKQLQGCRVELKVERIRYLLLPHNRRIWSAICDKGIALPYSRIVAHHQKINSTSSRWFVFGGLAFLLLGSVIGDRRVAKERKASAKNQVLEAP